MEKKYFVKFGYSSVRADIITIVCGSDDEAEKIARAIYKGSCNDKMYCEVFDENVAAEIVKGNAIMGKEKGFYQLIADCM